MANEVFISYSRLDYNKVWQIKKEIDQKIHIDCWMDITGIESGERFVDVIVSAINRHDTMLFMLSKNSMASEYALDEIDFAKQKNKRVVIVSIDDEPMTDNFYFKYHKYDNIKWYDRIQHDKLIDNLKTWFPSSLRGGQHVSLFKDEQHSNRYVHVFFLINNAVKNYGMTMENINEACSQVIKNFDMIRPDVDIYLNVLCFGGEAKWMYPQPVLIDRYQWNTINVNGRKCFGAACKELNRQMQDNAFFSPEKYGDRMMRPFILLLSDGDDTDETQDSLKILLDNPLFQKSERYAINISEHFAPESLKAFTGKKSKVFNLPMYADSRMMESLIQRLLLMGLYAGSKAVLDETDEYPDMRDVLL